MLSAPVKTCMSPFFYAMNRRPQRTEPEWREESAMKQPPPPF